MTHQTGFRPNLTLSRARQIIDVWIKGKNGKMESLKFEFFVWLEIFQILIKKLTFNTKIREFENFIAF